MNPSRGHFGSQTAWLVSLDAVCLLVSVAIGVSVRLGFGSIDDYLLGHLKAWILFCGGVLTANYVVGTYGIQIRFSRFNLFVAWLFSVVIGLLILSLTSYTWFKTPLGRGVLLLTIASYAVLWLISRILLYSF